MTCVVEEITTALWEKMKNDLSKEYLIRIERLKFHEQLVGENRVIHVESGNYMFQAPVMIRDRLSGWYFYIMNGRSICFRIYFQEGNVLEFYSNSKFNFNLNDYLEFQEQVTEIFGFSGSDLIVSEGCAFTPKFPCQEGD